VNITIKISDKIANEARISEKVRRCSMAGQIEFIMTDSHKNYYRNLTKYYDE
jgi:hypothetical protein